MSDPPDKKANAVNSLVAFTDNIAGCVNPDLDRVLAEAFLENLYAWLVEKGPPSPQDAAGLESK